MCLIEFRFEKTLKFLHIILSNTVCIHTYKIPTSRKVTLKTITTSQHPILRTSSQDVHVFDIIRKTM